MTRKIHKHIKRPLPLTIPKLSEKTEKREGEFPLYKSNTDKLHWCIEISLKGNTVKIADITFLIFVNDEWQWVVRYDDHGGDGLLHKHERLSLNDDSETTLSLPIRKNGNKKKLTEWAIDDIRKNYINYRRVFLKRNKVAALY